jgi:hypothetical protein
MNEVNVKNGVHAIALYRFIRMYNACLPRIINHSNTEGRSKVGIAMDVNNDDIDNDNGHDEHMV